jgi:hypothetical protein
MAKAIAINPVTIHPFILVVYRKTQANTAAKLIISPRIKALLLFLLFLILEERSSMCC